VNPSPNTVHLDYIHGIKGDFSRLRPVAVPSALGRVVQDGAFEDSWVGPQS